MLVVDDGSSDRSGDLLNKWSRTDARVRILENRGRGLVAALNLGLSESSNNWVARFDVDDIYPAVRISRQRAQIRSGIVAVFADYSCISEHEKYLGTIYSAIFSTEVSISLVNSQRTAHPSALINRRAVIEVGGYRSEDFPAEDLSLWLRLSRNGELISVPEILLNYRLNRNGVSSTKQAEMINQKHKLLAEIGINPFDLKDLGGNRNEGFRHYECYPHAEIRLAILFRDLYRCKELYGENASTREVEREIKMRLARSPKLLVDLPEQIFFRNLRNFYRK